MSLSADRNLLFGVLALQMNFISRDQLVAAMATWVCDKRKSLGAILVAQGAIRPSDLVMLEPVVARHIEQHGQDAQRSLAAVPDSPGIREAMQFVVDTDVQASVRLLGEHSRAPRNAASSPGGDAGEARYRILRPHARGGLGEVFVACDTELNREVALKEIQPAKDRDDSRARFVFEAEVTGGLEHPGIVPVYGLGHHADGRPYYAMRFIQGDNLATAIKRFHEAALPAAGAYESMEFRRLLQRFIDVCEAMAYAHSRGVLHRDLKPGNIMLGKYGETLIVDWGLAKTGAGPELVRQASNGEASLRPSAGSDLTPTQQGSALGTPAYMSPEQAEGKLDQLGPASDVYSLGATLYHLLVGKHANADCDLAELLYRTQLGAIPPARSVKPGVPQPLEAICKKAMAHRPADRYASATALATDIEQWLADEPVGAHEEPVRIRVRRWMRKHPGLVAGLATSLAVGMLGLVIGSVILGGKNRELAGLNKDLVSARAEADRKRDEAEKARDVAQVRYRLALDALNDMVFGIQNKLDNQPGTLELRKDLLENARKGLMKLVEGGDRLGKPDSTLVWSHLRAGDVDLLMGNVGAAEREYRAAHALAQSLATDPKDARARRDLGVSFEKLGNVLLRLNRPSEALDAYRKSLGISAALAAEDGDSPAQLDLSVSHNKVGDALLRLGQQADALDAYGKALVIRERIAAKDGDDRALRNLCVSLDNVGDVYLLLNRPADALAAYRRSVAISEQLVASTNNSQTLRDLSVGLENLGDVHLKLNQPADALDAYRKGHAISVKLAADSKDSQAQRDLSVSFDKLGNVYLRLNKPADALDAYQKGLAISEKLAADPTDAQAQSDLCDSLIHVGEVLMRLDRATDALGLFLKSTAICEKLASNPRDAQAQRDMVVAANRLGNAYLRLNRPGEALDAYRKSLAICETLASDAENTRAQRDLALAMISMGEAHRALKQFPAAIDWYKMTLELSKKFDDTLDLKLDEVRAALAACEEAIKAGR